MCGSISSDSPKFLFIKMVETGKSEKACSKDIYQGVYMNYNFVSAMTSFLGNVVKLQTIDGRIYEGIFLCFSPNFEVVLELVHEVKSTSSEIPYDNIIDKFVFSPENILTIEIVDAEITRDTFVKDCEINKLCSVTGLDDFKKELEPWDCPEENNIYELDLSGQEGWNPQEMFEKNEQLYGVTSDFNEDLSLYTSPLNKNDEYEEFGLVPKSAMNESSSLPAIVEHSFDIKSPSPLINSTKKNSTKGTKKSKTRKSQNTVNSSGQKDNQTFKTQKKGQQGNQKILNCTNSSASNCKRCGLVNETNIANECMHLYTQNSQKGIHSNLNPHAKEFVPDQIRPPVIPSFQIPYGLTCPSLMSAMPCHMTPQAPVYAPPFQPPTPYAAATFYTWKPMIYNPNYPYRQ